MPRTTPTEASIQIGQRIQSERHRYGLTREQLAEQMNVSIWYIIDVERGRTGLSVPGLVRLCKLFHCTSDYILFGTTEKASAIDARLASLPPAQREIMEDIIVKQLQLIEAASNPG